MCGIVGFVKHGDPGCLARMTAMITHRGPDDSGVAFFDGTPCVGLGSTRLAIQDLSQAGHQPMSTEDGQLTIVFNGEIYNFPALRAELEGRGHRFRSHSDTEVALELFRRHGASMLSRLNGMFAIAIWDAAHGRLFLARDRFGEKPLYLYERDGGLLFGSEVKSFLCNEAFTPSLDVNALFQYLTFLWVPEPGSMFAGVRKLPPAHCAWFQDGCLRTQPYWTLDLHSRARGTPTELAEEVRARLMASVRRRLVSDRPVGAFLSGGVDSSTMVAAMAQVSQEPLQLFTIGFPERDFEHESVESEVPRARAVAERIGARWEYLELDARVADLLPFVVWHLDEPLGDPAAITAYLLCRTAKSTRTVLLSGMGGDEVFAGYRRHLAFGLTESYRRLPSLVRRRLVPGALAALRNVRTGPFAGPLRDARLFVRGAELPFEERFIGYARYYTDDELDSLLSPELRERRAAVDVEATHLRHLTATTGADPLARMLYTDMQTFMPSLNMLYMDKMSMATAVEGRLPFLDHELVEFAAGIPPELKIRRRISKWILRKAFERDLPPGVIWNRAKVGFGAPIRTWLTRDLREVVADLLAPERIRARGLFDPSAVAAIASDPLVDRNCFRIWALMTLELWLQTFVDGAGRRMGPVAGSLAPTR